MQLSRITKSKKFTVVYAKIFMLDSNILKCFDTALQRLKSHNALKKCNLHVTSGYKTMLQI
jgi:hypothetical protein